MPYSRKPLRIVKLLLERLCWPSNYYSRGLPGSSNYYLRGLSSTSNYYLGEAFPDCKSHSDHCTFLGKLHLVKLSRIFLAVIIVLTSGDLRQYFYRRVGEWRLWQKLNSYNLLWSCSRKKKYQVTDYGVKDRRRHSLDMESSVENCNSIGETDDKVFENIRDSVAVESDSSNDVTAMPNIRTIYVTEAEVY